MTQGTIASQFLFRTGASEFSCSRSCVVFLRIPGLPPCFWTDECLWLALCDPWRYWSHLQNRALISMGLIMDSNIKTLHIY